MSLNYSKRDLFRILLEVKTQSGLIEKITEQYGSELNSHEIKTLCNVRRDFDRFIKEKYKNKKKKLDIEAIITSTSEEIVLELHPIQTIHASSYQETDKGDMNSNHP